MVLKQAMTPITPLEPGVQMFERGKSRDSFFPSTITVRSSLERPISSISLAYTDIEDDSSEFEEYSGSSVRQLRQLRIYARLTIIRATTGEVRQPSQHLKKYEHQEMRRDHSMLIGIYPKLWKAPEAHIFSALPNHPTISTSLCRCPHSCRKTPQPVFRHLSESPPLLLSFLNTSTTT